MKSIEELLEIIKGVDMDLWDNVEQEAYDEILSRFAEQKGIINSLCVRWGHSIRLIAIIEERFKQRCELSINCNNCYAGLLTKINKESLVEHDLTDLSLYSEREKLICDQKKKITELEKQIKEARYEAIGWTHAFCCTSLDKGLDPRKADVAEMLKQAKKDLTREERK